MAALGEKITSAREASKIKEDEYSQAYDEALLQGRIVASMWNLNRYDVRAIQHGTLRAVDGIGKGDFTDIGLGIVEAGSSFILLPFAPVVAPAALGYKLARRFQRDQ